MKIMKLEKIQAYDKLIKAVHKRSPLWDNSLKEHKNPEVTSVLWSQVAAELNIEVLELMKKFKHLRDTYVKELRKQQNYKKLSPDGEFQYISTWPLFHKLTFLKEIVIKPRINKHNSSDLKSLDEETLQAMLENNQSCELVASIPGMEDNVSASPPLAVPTWSGKKRKKTDAPANVCVQLGSIGNTLLDDSKSDSLEHFSLSLIPHLRRVPEHKLLQCQVQLLEVLVAYTEDS